MYIKQVIICKLLVIICKLFGKMSVKKHHLNSSGFSLPTTKTGHLNLGVYPNSKQTKSQQRPVIASRSGRRAGLFPSVFHLNCERAGSALGWVIAMAKSHQNPMCLPMSCRLWIRIFLIIGGIKSPCLHIMCICFRNQIRVKSAFSQVWGIKPWFTHLSGIKSTFILPFHSIRIRSLDLGSPTERSSSLVMGKRRSLIAQGRWRLYMIKPTDNVFVGGKMCWKPWVFFAANGLKIFKRRSFH